MKSRYRSNFKSSYTAALCVKLRHMKTKGAVFVYMGRLKLSKSAQPPKSVVHSKCLRDISFVLSNQGNKTTDNLRLK